MSIIRNVGSRAKPVGWTLR